MLNSVELFFFAFFPLKGSGHIAQAGLELSVKAKWP